jgi:hypothetical protein
VAAAAAAAAGTWQVSRAVSSKHIVTSVGVQCGAAADQLRQLACLAQPPQAAAGNAHVQGVQSSILYKHTCTAAADPAQ